MAKQGWAGLSEARIAKRLGGVLGVAFDAPALGAVGGSVGLVATAGEDAWVVLHVERKHAHPAENVVQYWPWLERNRRRLVLVHAIAPDARRRRGPRADLTSWLGAVMERVLPGRFAYRRLEIGSDGEAAQLAAAVEAIEALRQPPRGRELVRP